MGARAGIGAGTNHRKEDLVAKKARITLDALAKSGVELREDDLKQINGGAAGSMVCTKTSGGWRCSGDSMTD